MRHRFHRMFSLWKLGVLLLLVAGLFWIVTGWLDRQVLSQPHASLSRLQAAGTSQVQLSFRLTIVSVDVVVDRSTQVTEVNIRTSGSPLEELEFKFPVIEFDAIETAIAQELKLPASDIRKLIRYRVNR